MRAIVRTQFSKHSRRSLINLHTRYQIRADWRKSTVDSSEIHKSSDGPSRDTMCLLAPRRPHRAWLFLSVGISLGSRAQVDGEKAAAPASLSACPRSGPHARVYALTRIGRGARRRARSLTRARRPGRSHTRALWTDERRNKVRWSLGRWPDAGPDQTSASRAESRHEWGRRDGSARKKRKETENKRISARRKSRVGKWKFIRATFASALTRKRDARGEEKRRACKNEKKW